MKKSCLLIFIFCLFSVAGIAQSKNILPKKWLFRVDPAGGIMNEFRFSFGRRIKQSSFFLYGAPFAVRLNRIGEGQKQFGAGLRTGIRQYIIGENPPHGFFVYFGVAYRLLDIKFFNAELIKTGSTTLHSPGVGIATGYQWLFGPQKSYGRSNNFVFGLSGGVEYFINNYKDGYTSEDVIQRWYQLSFLNELRIYLSVEVGFAFRQRKRAW